MHFTMAIVTLVLVEVILLHDVQCTVYTTFLFLRITIYFVFLNNHVVLFSPTDK
jgi:hypothetical protein